MIDLRVRDVLTTDTPLVGAYSQFGWNHPGPAIYWMLAPFSWIAGGDPWGMIVGSAVIQGGALVAAVLVAKRSAGAMWAILWAMVGALSYVPMGPWAVLEAWNPHLGYPIFLLFAVLAWRCARVRGSYAVWVVVVGSVLVQLHIGYLPLVGAIAAWVIWRCWRASALEMDHEPLRPAFLQIGVAVVLLWTVPVLQALMNRGGNLRALLNYFLLGEGDGFRAGPSVAGRLMATEFRLPPPWLWGPGDKDPLTALTDGYSGAWLLIAVVLVGVGVAVFRRCDEPAKSLLALSWIALASGLVALALMRGKVAPYLFYWRSTVAILVVTAVLAAGWSMLPERIRACRRTLGAACAVVLVAVASLGFTIDIARAPDDVMEFEPIARELVERVESVPGPVIMRWVGSPDGGLHAGVLDGLEREGLPVGVDTGYGFQFGKQRETRLEDAAEVWVVSEQGFTTSVVEVLPGARVVAESSPLTASENDELSALQNRAIKELLAADSPDVIPKLDSPLAVFDMENLGVLDETARQRFVELSGAVTESGTYRAAIIAFPPTQAPSTEDLAFLAPTAP